MHFDEFPRKVRSSLSAEDAYRWRELLANWQGLLAHDIDRIEDLASVYTRSGMAETALYQPSVKFSKSELGQVSYGRPEVNEVLRTALWMSIKKRGLESIATDEEMIDFYKICIQWMPEYRVDWLFRWIDTRESISIGEKTGQLKELLEEEDCKGQTRMLVELNYGLSLAEQAIEKDSFMLANEASDWLKKSQATQDRLWVGLESYAAISERHLWNYFGILDRRDSTPRIDYKSYSHLRFWWLQNDLSEAFADKRWIDFLYAAKEVFREFIKGDDLYFFVGKLFDGWLSYYVDGWLPLNGCHPKNTHETNLCIIADRVARVDNALLEHDLAEGIWEDVLHAPDTPSQLRMFVIDKMKGIGKANPNYDDFKIDLQRLDSDDKEKK